MIRIVIDDITRDLNMEYIPKALKALLSYPYVLRHWHLMNLSCTGPITLVHYIHFDRFGCIVQL